MGKLYLRFTQRGSDRMRAEYQNATAAWAVRQLERADQKGVLLCDPVGNGKTWEALLTVFNLACDPVRNIKRILIVAPKGELGHKWVSELRRTDVFARLDWRRTVTPPAILSLQERDMGQYDGPYVKGCWSLLMLRHNWQLEKVASYATWPLGVTVVTAHILRQIADRPNFASSFNCIIYDECHHARKRTNNATYKTFIQLRRANPNMLCLGLTATPAGARQLDTTLLIETVCLPVAEIAATGVPKRLEPLAASISEWCKDGGRRNPKLRASLQAELGRYVSRTPNQRRRSYFLTGHRPVKIEGISAMPIPNPFKMDGGHRTLASQEPLEIDDLATLTAIQAAATLRTNDERLDPKYAFLTAGMESLELVAKRQPVASAVFQDWAKNTPTHPKIARLLHFSQDFFNPHDPTALANEFPAWHDRGKLLLFCGVKSVVKSPFWKIHRELRALLRKAIKKKLVPKTLGVSPAEIPRRLGKSTSAAFTRALKRIFSGEHVPSGSHTFSREEVRDLIRKLSRMRPEEVWRRIIHGTDHVGYADGLLSAIDLARDEVLRRIFFPRSPIATGLSSQQELEYLGRAFKYLDKNKPQAFDEPWFGLGAFVDTVGKKVVRGKGPYPTLNALFLLNHALILEAYRATLRRTAKIPTTDRRNIFFECMWELMSAVHDVAKTNRTIRRRRKGRATIDHPLLDPSLPVETLTGDLGPGAARNELIARFKLPINPMVLFCTEVGTEGIDLHTYCWDVVLYTIDWVPSQIEQKIGRIDRERQMPNEALHAFHAGDPRYHAEVKKDLIRVHFFVLPETYDERILFRVNRRATEERSLFSQKVASFKDDNAMVRESLDLCPKKESGARGRARSS
jgi:superfamily II DNA or RNA helicase